MSIGAIIQARMGSTRLPGKVLKDVGGDTMLARVIQRTQRARFLDKVVVATTIEAADEAIVAECRRLHIPVFRGNEDDVLDRYYQAARTHQIDTIVRITSDCPLVEPEVIDEVVQTFKMHDSSLDYAANILSPRTFPRGLDVEVISFEALARTWREDKNPAWREHVTPYIYRNPEKFQVLNVTNETDYSWMRWTVDTPEDLVLVRRIYDHFGDYQFNWQEVIALLVEYPAWLDINRSLQQKQIC